MGPILQSHQAALLYKKKGPPHGGRIKFNENLALIENKNNRKSSPNHFFLLPIINPNS